MLVLPDSAFIVGVNKLPERLAEVIFANGSEKATMRAHEMGEDKSPTFKSFPSHNLEGKSS